MAIHPDVARIYVQRKPMHRDFSLVNLLNFAGLICHLLFEVYTLTAECMSVVISAQCGMLTTGK